MANKPEDICVSLETARRLHDAGIVIDSCFYWIQYDAYDFELRTDFHLVSNDAMENKRHDDTVNVLRYYPAPTAEEFDYTELPDSIVRNGTLYFLRITKAVNHWRLYYYDRYDEHDSFPDYDYLDPFPKEHKLCEVMASVVIWLKQNIESEVQDV